MYTVITPMASIVLLVVMSYQLIDNWNIIQNDVYSNILPDHIVYSGESLSVHITIVFTARLRHGLTLHGMLTSTMIPITKADGQMCPHLSIREPSL